MKFFTLFPLFLFPLEDYSMLTWDQIVVAMFLFPTVHFTSLEATCIWISGGFRLISLNFLEIFLNNSQNSLRCSFSIFSIDFRPMCWRGPDRVFMRWWCNWLWVVTYCPTSLFSLIFMAQTEDHKPVHKLQEFFLGLPTSCCAKQSSLSEVEQLLRGVSTEMFLDDSAFDRGMCQCMEHTITNLLSPTIISSAKSSLRCKECWKLPSSPNVDKLDIWYWKSSMLFSNVSIFLANLIKIKTCRLCIAAMGIFWPGYFEELLRRQ